MPDNTILAKFNATGASDRTARQDGLAGGSAASVQMAKTDFARVQRLIERFNAAGDKFGLPPALLAAIASRESRCGNILDAQGWGDHGNAFGIMQVDKRFHDVAGQPDPRSEEHINQATSIVRDYFQAMQRKFPAELEERQLQAAVAAYNCGTSRVVSPDRADEHTTGQDYSNDIWARANFFASQWAGAQVET